MKNENQPKVDVYFQWDLSITMPMQITSYLRFKNKLHKWTLQLKQIKHMQYSELYLCIFWYKWLLLYKVNGVAWGFVAVQFICNVFICIYL